MVNVKIIDYKAGNAPSVLHAAARLGYEAEFARGAGDLENATHILLPGVGSAKATMESLRGMGLLKALEDAVFRRKAFFLGICIGMQILFGHSEEEDTDCLGWLDGRVVKFDAKKVRVPQMGWNEVSFIKRAPCDARDDFFYFVNSYYANPEKETDRWGTADYGGAFSAAVCRDNIYGAQFHVEKSGEAGLRLLGGFLALDGGG